MSGLYTIPFGYSFADELAAGAFRLAAGNPWRLAQVRILLPNRRAIRSLTQSFLRLNAQQPLLLPKMQALGDMDEEEASLLEEDQTLENLPPAIAPLRRRVLLARLIQSKDRDGHISLLQAMLLGKALAEFLDEMQIEQIDPRELAKIVAEEFALHWEETLVFLRIVTDAWPEILAQEKALDPMERRHILMTREAQQLLRLPPPDAPILAAGSTGSVPATAQWMKAILSLKQGYVVLPGLDLSLTEKEQSLISETPSHPQYGMVRLLGKLEKQLEDIQLWPGSMAAPKISVQRQALVKAAMAPADATNKWLDIAKNQPDLRQGWMNVHRIDCRTEQEEARIVAILLRESLAEEGKSAALITADRQLARRVTAELRLWQIDVDDSAGQSLALTAIGSFLQLLAQANEAGFAPVSLLALLKHPFAQAGLEQGQFRHLSRLLEVNLLRGARPKGGLGTIGDLLRGRENISVDVLSFWTRIETILRPLEEAAYRGLKEYLKAFIEAAEDLAIQELWVGEAGELAFKLLQDMDESFGDLSNCSPGEFSMLLSDLMRELAIRPAYGKHPRVFIWGPLEARLQKVDRAILGGLNEGSWPRDDAIDPWLNREMRSKLGLPPLQRKVGQAAHDFCQALGNEEVFLTRAQRAEGAPTQPSRWLLRLEAFLACLGISPTQEKTDHYRTWALELDRPAFFRAIARPAPNPQADLRPRRLSVSKIETWLDDPYAIFAQYILRLRALPPLDQDPAAAERGTLLHAIFHEYVSSAVFTTPLGDRLSETERLRKIADRHFTSLDAYPNLLAFWRPAFDKVALWFVQKWQEQRTEIARSFCEIEGALQIGSAENVFTLSGRADRIDILKTGGIVIVDYKTGNVPSTKKAQEGNALQLPLEGWMVKAGAFQEIAAGAFLQRLEYWGLRASQQKVTVIADPAEELIDLAWKRFLGILEYYARTDAIYPSRASKKGWSDYTHLARLGEWSSVGETQDD